MRELMDDRTRELRADARAAGAGRPSAGLRHRVARLVRRGRTTR